MVEINPRKLYVGNLPRDYTETDLASDFSAYGRIAHIEFKGRFGFVEYESSSSAADALSALSGMVRHGERIQVKAYRHVPPRHLQGSLGGFESGSERGVGQSKRTAYRVAVLGVHEKTSWQDLKDFGRRVGEVNYADVFRGPEGSKKGLLEFYDAAAMDAAIYQLSGQLFLGAEVQVVPANDASRPVGRSISPCRGNRSRSRSRRRDEWVPIPRDLPSLRRPYDLSRHHRNTRSSESLQDRRLPIETYRTKPMNESFRRTGERSLSHNQSPPVYGHRESRQSYPKVIDLSVQRHSSPYSSSMQHNGERHGSSRRISRQPHDDIPYHTKERHTTYNDRPVIPSRNSSNGSRVYASNSRGPPGNYHHRYHHGTSGSLRRSSPPPPRHSPLRRRPISPPIHVSRTGGRGSPPYHSRGGVSPPPPGVSGRGSRRGGGEPIMYDQMDSDRCRSRPQYR